MGVSQKKAVIYLRVSSPGQVKKDYDAEGLSLPAQREACTDKAHALGATVVEEFVEPGVSAKSVNKRKAFQSMLKTIQSRGDIDYVIVWSVSRWARNQEDHWVARGMIDRANARLVSVKEQVGGSSASEVVMEGVMAAVAAGRRLEISEDVQRGIKRKAQVGGTPFRAPIGYVNVAKIIDGREIRDVVPDPDRAHHVTDAFRLYATGQYSLEELAALLETRGLRSRPSARTPAQRLNANRLSSLLRNDYYVGRVTLNGKSYEGRHGALVSLELFEEVQSLLTSRRHHGARAWRHHHYLAGSLFCGGCGGRLLYSRNRGRSGTAYEYFFCIGKQDGSCGQPYHRLADLERAVERHYCQVSIAKAESHALREFLRAELHVLGGANDRDLTAAEESLALVNAQERKLLAAHYDDNISPELPRIYERQSNGPECKGTPRPFSGVRVPKSKVWCG